MVLAVIKGQNSLHTMHYVIWDVSVAQLVASMSGVGGVVEVLGSNLARGHIYSINRLS